MTDNPLAAADPRALFGPAALEDRRELRRAYSQLIKRFRPEACPDEFRHIRALYEVAMRLLDAGSTATAGPTIVDDDALVEALVASLDGDNLDATLDRLRSRALQDASSAAATTVFGAQLSRDALLALRWVADLAGGPEALAPLTLQMFGYLLHARPSLVVEPETARIVDGLSSLPGRAAAGLLIDALLRVGRTDDALAHFEEIQSGLRRDDFEAWWRLFGRVVAGVAWTASRDRLDRWQELIDRADLDLPPPVYWDLTRLLVTAAEWQEAGRAGVDARVLHAVRACWGASRPLTWTALCDLADGIGGDPSPLEALSRRWPSLSFVIRRGLLFLDGSERRFVQRLQNPEEPVTVDKLTGRAIRWMEQQQDQPVIRLRDRLRAWRRGCREGLLGAAVIFGVLYPIALVAGYWYARVDGLWAAAIFGAFGGCALFAQPVSQLFIGDWVPDDLEWPPVSPEAWIELLRRRAEWPDELRAALVAMSGEVRALHPADLPLWSDLRALGYGHLRRVLSEEASMMAEAAAADAAGGGSE